MSRLQHESEGEIAPRSGHARRLGCRRRATASYQYNAEKFAAIAPPQLRLMDDGYADA